MIGKTAIAVALPGFNDLGLPVTPIFLLIDHFLYLFPTLREKNKENLLIKSLINFSHNAPSNSVLFSSLFICTAVSNASCENVGNI